MTTDTGSIDFIIAHLAGDAQKRHFETIASAHPDFMEVNESFEFQAWKASKSMEELAFIERVLSAGSASEVIAILSDFKSKNDMEMRLEKLEHDLNERLDGVFMRFVIEMSRLARSTGQLTRLRVKKHEENN